jgi:hypothetical protein
MADDGERLGEEGERSSDHGQGKGQAAAGPRTAVNQRALRRAGFLVNDDDEDRAFALAKRRGGGQGQGEGEDEFDRDFYLSDAAEGGGVMGERGFLGSQLKFQQREDQMSKSRARGEVKLAGKSAKASQLHRDQDAWEDNRMLASGVSTVQEAQMFFDEEESSRVTLIVHNLKPPFLQGLKTALEMLQ